MKTTLALLLTGLFLVATPMLASAHGGKRHDERTRYTERWQPREYRGHDHNHRRKYAKKHHWKKHHRQHRKVVYRPRYSETRVVYRLPGLVFHIDW